MKKYYEYCEVICPPRFISMQSVQKRADAITTKDGEKVYVLFGTNADGTFAFLLDDKGRVRYFETPIDAVNWLSKNDGWRLVKTFTCASESSTCAVFEHWVMAREVKEE